LSKKNELSNEIKAKLSGYHKTFKEFKLSSISDKDYFVKFLENFRLYIREILLNINGEIKGLQNFNNELRSQLKSDVESVSIKRVIDAEKEYSETIKTYEKIKEGIERVENLSQSLTIGDLEGKKKSLETRSLIKELNKLRDSIRHGVQEYKILITTGEEQQNFLSKLSEGAKILEDYVLKEDSKTLKKKLPLFYNGIKAYITELSKKISKMHKTQETLKHIISKYKDIGFYSKQAKSIQELLDTLESHRVQFVDLIRLVNALKNKVQETAEPAFLDILRPHVNFIHETLQSLPDAPSELGHIREGLIKSFQVNIWQKLIAFRKGALEFNELKEFIYSFEKSISDAEGKVKNLYKS